MKLLSPKRRTRLHGAFRVFGGSVVAKLLIATLCLAIAGLIAVWLSRGKTSHPTRFADLPPPVQREIMLAQHERQGSGPRQPGVAKASPPRPLAITPLEHLSWPNQAVWKRSLLETNPPSWQENVGLKLDDEFKSELLAFFRAQTNITIRESLAWPLARMGGADVFQALTSALTNDYHWAKLELDDAVDLSDILSRNDAIERRPPIGN